MSDVRIKSKILELFKGDLTIKYVGYLESESYFSLLRVIDCRFSLIDPKQGLNNFFGIPNKLTEYLTFSRWIISTVLIDFINEIKSGCNFDKF